MEGQARSFGAPPAHGADAVAPQPPHISSEGLGQLVLVLQGGGALGAYQCGAFQALTEAGIGLDWVIGTSIGAINAAIIVGNPPERRLEQLERFWSCVGHEPFAQLLGAFPWFGGAASNALTVAAGVRGLFEPNLAAAWGLGTRLGAEEASLYSTAPLKRSLEEFVDFEYLHHGPTRLTVGAANVGTGMMRYFDTTRERLDHRHILASGALPPAFPAVRIDGELYWDGGVLSNTPIEAVFDDNPRRSGLVFSVNIWNPMGSEPDSVWKVIAREKDLRYASRAKVHIARQKQIHRLRHVIMELAAALPEEVRQQPRIRGLESYGCVTRMHVVRLLAPPLDGEDHSKDIDFSPQSISQRWQAGFADTCRVLEQRPWEDDADPTEGLILHEAASGQMMVEG